MAKTMFFLGIIVAASGVLSPPLALALGLIFGLTCIHPLPAEASSLAKLLLKVSVVGLGFGMNLNEVLRVGRQGLLYTAAGIAFAMLAGWALGRWLRVPSRASYLISIGTAICGGSAIAAVAPILAANEEEMAVSLGTIFTLNAVALLLFPAIGLALKLTQSQFGLWAALAIHDTSSVVGATAKYGAQALAVGTTVKLARALWIVPMSLGTAAVTGRMADGSSRAKIQWPWFILFFCLATVANTYLPVFAAYYPEMKHLGLVGLTVTLFLIGTGISVQSIRKVGSRPLLQGVLLWVAIATGSLALILRGGIHP